MRKSLINIYFYKRSRNKQLKDNSLIFEILIIVVILHFKFMKISYIDFHGVISLKKKKINNCISITRGRSEK